MAGDIGPIDMPDPTKNPQSDGPQVNIPGDENRDDENQNPTGGNAPLARPEETNETVAAPDAAPTE